MSISKIIKNLSLRKKHTERRVATTMNQKEHLRGKYRIILDQNITDYLNPCGGYADSIKAARSIQKRKNKEHPTLSYSIEKIGLDGFWRKVS